MHLTAMLKVAVEQINLYMRNNSRAITALKLYRKLLHFMLQIQSMCIVFILTFIKGKELVLRIVISALKGTSVANKTNL